MDNGNAAAVIDVDTDQLLAILAHELRSPLVPIRNAAALLKHVAPDPVTIRRAAEIIERQANEMHRLISDLLDVSRIQRGTIRLRRVIAPLAKLIDLALKSSEGCTNDRGHHVTSSVSPENIFVNMDLMCLTQALRHVVANATKYTDRPGLIHIRGHREGSQAVVYVRDTGIGIAHGELEKIFGLFARSAQGGRVEPGLGLGLFLARHFVEAHGGTITATSAGVGLGSEFAIRLPSALPTALEFESDGAVPAGDLSPA